MFLQQKSLFSKKRKGCLQKRKTFGINQHEIQDKGFEPKKVLYKLQSSRKPWLLLLLKFWTLFAKF